MTLAADVAGMRVVQLVVLLCALYVVMGFVVVVVLVHGTVVDFKVTVLTPYEVVMVLVAEPVVG